MFFFKWDKHFPNSKPSPPKQRQTKTNKEQQLYHTEVHLRLSTKFHRNHIGVLIDHSSVKSKIT